MPAVHVPEGHWHQRASAETRRGTLRASADRGEADVPRRRRSRKPQASDGRRGGRCGSERSLRPLTYRSATDAGGRAQQCDTTPRPPDIPTTPVAVVQHGRRLFNRGSAAGLQMVECTERSRQHTPRHVGYVVSDQGARGLPGRRCSRISLRRNDKGSWLATCVPHGWLRPSAHRATDSDAYPRCVDGEAPSQQHGPERV